MCFATKSAVRADDIEELRLSNIARVGLYAGHTFVYDSRHSIRAESPKSRSNELKIYRPLESSIVYRRLWIASIKNPGEPYDSEEMLVDRIVGFDGHEARKFDRKYAPKNFRIGQLLSHAAGSLPIEIKEYDYHFEIFLTGGPDLDPQYLYPDGVTVDFKGTPVKLPPFRVVEENSIHNGRMAITVERVYQGARNRCVVDKGKEHLVLSAKVFVGQKLFQSYEVSKVGQADKFAYPQKGKFEQHAFENDPEESFEFEVKSVTPNASEEFQFPPWPLGTNVIDAQGNTVTYRPYPQFQR